MQLLVNTLIIQHIILHLKITPFLYFSFPCEKLTILHIHFRVNLVKSTNFSKSNTDCFHCDMQYQHRYINIYIFQYKLCIITFIFQR